MDCSPTAPAATGSPMLLPTDARFYPQQEGLYSFLVRLLVAHDRGGPTADTMRLPPLRPEGVSPSLLVR